MRHAAGGLRRRCLLGAALIGALVGFGAPTHAADHEHGGDSDWLVFPSLIGRTHWDDNGPPPSPYNDWIKADLLYTHTSGSFRVLAESEISNQEAEIERLQFGWELNETTLLWLGRFHQPTSAWNTDHHHGQYLQTSITRPSIERWEDEGGILPQHVAGALLDSRGALTGNSGLVISVGAGAGPVVTSDGLDPVRVIHANHGGHRAAFSARVGFLPDLLGEDAFGLMYAHYDMPVVEASARAELNADTVTQQVIGAYANVFRSNWRLRSVLYHVDEGNESAAGTRRHRFDAGYAQLEYSAPASLTPYGRLESSSALAGTDFVLLQRDGVDVRRALLGLRWDFHRHQALTLEVAHAATAVTSYHEARLQWSGVLP